MCNNIKCRLLIIFITIHMLTLNFHTKSGEGGSGLGVPAIARSPTIHAYGASFSQYSQ